MRNTLLMLMTRAENVIATGVYDDADKLLSETGDLKNEFSRLRKLQLDRIQEDHSGNLAISLVYLNLLQESQELASAMRHMVRANGKFQGITK